MDDKLKEVWNRAHEIRRYNTSVYSAELLEWCANTIEAQRTEITDLKDRNLRMRNLIDTQGNNLEELWEKLKNVIALLKANND